MERQEPNDPSSSDDDALRRLERRLDRASAAAERLVAEAARAAADGPSGTPSAGWQTPGQERETSTEPADGDLLVQLLGSLRELIPPELQRRLAEAVREVLLALRALIDWYLERVERRQAQPAEVEDIPIL